MKEHVRNAFRGKSVRLAVAYWAIIMSLSLVLSFVFYDVSRPVFEESTPEAIEKTVAEKMAQNPSLVRLEQTPKPDVEAPPKKLETVRSAFLLRLIVLNAIVALGGGVMSLYLARRTLRPIELAAETQSRFASDASHELRTPLAGMRVRNEVALRKPNLTLAEAKEVIRDDTTQIVRLEVLVTGLLRLSRRDQGAAMRPVSLQEIAGEAMNVSIATAQAKRMSIEERVPNLMVSGDMPSLVQAVAIVLDNAIKYSSRQTVIYLEGDTKGKYAYLHVRDEGQGIDPQDLPHIFERFYRADQSRSEPGYGLGLALAQELVIQNKGTITARSTRGAGTIITLKLPMA